MVRHLRHECIAGILDLFGLEPRLIDGASIDYPARDIAQLNERAIQPGRIGLVGNLEYPAAGPAHLGRPGRQSGCKEIEGHTRQPVRFSASVTGRQQAGPVEHRNETAIACEQAALIVECGNAGVDGFEHRRQQSSCRCAIIRHFESSLLHMERSGPGVANQGAGNSRAISPS